MNSASIVSFVIGIAATVGVFMTNWAQDTRKASQDFAVIVNESVTIASRRIEDYAHTIENVIALFDASDDVTETDFHNFIGSLNLDTRNPAIQGIGYIDSDGREFYAAAGSLSQQSSYQNAVLDVSGRLRGIDRLEWIFDAPTSASGTSTQNQTMLARPISQNIGTVEPIMGWIFTTVDLQTAFQNITSLENDAYALAVRPVRPDAQSADIMINTQPEDGQFVENKTITAAGQTWNLTFESSTAFEKRHLFGQRWLILLVGFFISALAAIAAHNGNQKQQARHELALLRERELQTKEIEKHSILENRIMAIVIFDANEVIVHANAAAAEIFEFTKSELIGRPFSSIAQKESLDGEIGRFEAEGITKSGSTLQLFVQLNNWLTSGGISRTTAVIRDLTAEQHSAKRLEDAETRFKLALQGAKIGVFEIDLTTNKSEVTDTWFDIMNLPIDRDAFDAQKHFLSRIHPDDLPILMEADRACIAGETLRSIADYRISFGDDDWRWMRSDAVAINRCQMGRALNLVGTQIDVTDLKMSQTALEASETRFKMAMVAAPVGMALLDGDGRFTAVNAAMSAFLDYPEDTLRDDVRMSDILDKADHRSVYRAVMSNFADGQTQVYQAEHQIILRSGARKWGLFSASTTFDESTQSYMFIVQINDIDDQKQVDKMKAQFVSTVSHELRTPLTSIAGAIGIVQATAAADLSPKVSRLIDIAKNNADRLTSLINDILDLEKISSNETQFTIASVDIVDIAQGVVDALGPLAATHSNKIKLDTADAELCVLADSDRMAQVFENLVSNACKYSDPNTDITVRIETQGQNALVFVMNQGDSIPAIFRSQVFNAFAQADSSDTRSKGGTGLGLNITKQIVERFEGEIGFESNPDTPTVFWFTCPLDDTVPMAEIGKHPSLLPGVIPMPRRKQRVLHLEDDQDFAEVIKSALSGIAEVTNVSSIAEARDIIGRVELDTIIVDWSLSDGLADCLIDQIVQTYPHAKILALSAQETFGHDDRISVNLLKSRTKVSSILRVVQEGAA